MAEAWRLYENRYRREPNTDLAAITCADTGTKIPHWTSGPIPKRLLVVCEQGLGDTFHFIRYVRRLLDVGTEVTLAEWPHLHPILSTVHPDLALTARNDAVTSKAGDAYVRLLSLPLRMGLLTPIFDRPYLQAQAGLIRRWSKTTNPMKLNVGLVWQGNPDHEHDFRRSIPLEILAPLADLPNVNLVSLQHGAGQEQINSASFNERLIQPKGLFAGRASFLSLAALMSSMDVVVSVDTAPAHLAGALGVPCFLLLHTPDPDWRWGSVSSSTPWYPNMQLYRQSVPGDWGRVTDSIVNALGSFDRRS